MRDNLTLIGVWVIAIGMTAFAIQYHRSNDHYYSNGQCYEAHDNGWSEY